MKALLTVWLVVFSVSVEGFAKDLNFNQSSTEKISHTIVQEYLRIREYVSQLVPDGKVGGYLNEKKLDGYVLLWKLGQGGSDGDRIRIYRSAEKYGDGFSVDYYTGTHFIEGREVLRRFIGLERTGWRNHTIDLEDGYYYGSQGASTPRMTEFDREILKNWKITVFSR